MVREITSDEVKRHHDRRSAWIIIHNDVYDVTSFLGEHPGGEESLLEFAGKDGTKGFEDVGHSQDAREMLVKYKIGTLPACEITKKHPGGEESLLEFAGKDGTKGFEDVGHSQDAREMLVKYKIGTLPACEITKKSIHVPIGKNSIYLLHSKLKWAVIALAGAIVIGFALKKYLS
ncbi:Cytochrome b5 [Papilio xuthus]|uniref:Cytochrome b5 n=1 Tax=Papilio xuthus TaxID=66420 RepID=A0A194PCM4_PAPXU|nr:Cytochrome b5 [Papilio xuthus]